MYPGTPQERAQIESTLDGPVRVDILLEAPTRFNLGRGVGLQVLSVPGHVEAEMAYYEPSSGSLILGDAITGTEWSFLHGHMQRSALLATIARMRAFAVNHRLERALLAHYPLMDRQQFLALLDRVEAYVARIDQTIIEIVREATDGVDLETIWRAVCQRMNKQLEFRGLLTVDGHVREMTAAGLLERVGPDRYRWVGGSGVAQFARTSPRDSPAREVLQAYLPEALKNRVVPDSRHRTRRPASPPGGSPRDPASMATPPALRPEVPWPCGRWAVPPRATPGRR
jgi:glyoxylase-like metal-dependent hydrolase (beta-lactamase superfamily II)